MQHITYMEETIRLRGKLAPSCGNLILVPYPSNTMWMKEYQANISQSKFLHVWRT